ncbi:uncharacterized protein PG986_000644 [Apiospora aurea]|uniref:Uncharacterized protein n=1 Tax=Apiospora aurea TaxID=335848 RepID=A0ABR1QUK3_9PEZI
MPENMAHTTPPQAGSTPIPANEDQSLTMDIPHNLEPQCDVLDQTKTATTSTPALLTVPREIRDQIYSQFLLADQVHELAFEHNHDQLPEWCNLSILHINQQLRDEAWDYFIRANTWIRSQPYFPSEAAPRKYAERVAKEASLTLRLGSACDATEHTTVADDNKGCKAFILAYKPTCYGIFVEELAVHASEIKDLTMQMSSTARPGSAMFAKIVEPLRIIRNLNNVWFPGVANCPTIQLMSQEMKLPFNSVKELFAIGPGDYSVDSLSPWTWIKLAALGREVHEGTPTYNSLFHIRTDMCIGFARAAHKYLLQLAEFLAFLPDEKRFGDPYFPWHFHFFSRPDVYDGGAGSYDDAAKHLFYAKAIDPSSDILDSLDSDESAMYRRIDSPPPEGFEILERDIPLMDTWRVAPELWERWRSLGSPLFKKLLEQRHIVDSGAEPEDVHDLSHRYRAVVIAWNYTRDFGLNSIIRRLWVQSDDPVHHW